jgi:hypothetical protein
VELNARKRDQSTPSVMECARQALTRLGTTPSIPTRASATKRQNAGVLGASSHSAMVARFKRLA